MRTVSSRPCKNGGYLHPLDAEFKPSKQFQEPPAPPSIDADAMMKDFSFDTDLVELKTFAESLGVTLNSLQLIGCQRSVRYQSWAFPMFNGFGKVCGIRLRRKDGSKFAVPGSKQGIFMMSKEPSPTAYIVEGASDLAALASIGLYGIGRPQCCGCIQIITSTLSRLRISRVVIISDSDDPGINGTESLQKELDIPSVIFMPPAKDFREAVKIGMSVPLIESTVRGLTWTVPLHPPPHSVPRPPPSSLRSSPRSSVARCDAVVRLREHQ